MNIGNQISAIRKEQQLTQEHLDTLIKEDSKMVKAIDKERVLGKIKKEKSIIDFLRVQELELLYPACFHPIPYAEL